MKPPKREKTDFEKVTIEDFTICTIAEITYDMEHKFTGFEGAADTVKPAVRFKFDVEGYKFQHYSRWMKFVLSEKSNLYSKYISQLVEGAEPDMDLDLDILKGMKCKILWAEKNDFQFPETVRPIGGKIKADAKPATREPGVDDELDEFVDQVVQGHFSPPSMGPSCIPSTGMSTGHHCTRYSATSPYTPG